MLYIHYLYVSLHLSQYHMQKTLSFPMLNVLALVIKRTDELCIDLSLGSFVCFIWLICNFFVPIPHLGSFIFILLPYHYLKCVNFCSSG